MSRIVNLGCSFGRGLRDGVTCLICCSFKISLSAFSTLIDIILCAIGLSFESPLGFLSLVFNVVSGIFPRLFSTFGIVAIRFGFSLATGLQPFRLQRWGRCCR